MNPLSFSNILIGTVSAIQQLTLSLIFFLTVIIFPLAFLEYSELLLSKYH